MMEGPSANSEEKHEPVGDIDTAAGESLKALDPERPIREADILFAGRAQAFATAKSNHDKLAHHAGVLVLENMAVIHVRMVGVREVCKLGDDADCRTWIDKDGIF